MDFREKALSVIKSHHSFQKRLIKDYEFIQEICELFDMALKENLSVADFYFLKYISSEIGVPQYFGLLTKRKNSFSLNYDLLTLSFEIPNWPLITDTNHYLHRYQKQILDMYDAKKTNRFFLSAPTSFGKTYLVYEIIKKMKYKNILLIFPTIALLSENHAKLIDYRRDKFWRQYSIHTLSEDQNIGSYNIWLFTPERYLSFLDNNKNIFYDFSFMDEIYKIDNQFVVDAENICENERDVAFRVALHYLCKNSKDILLAGPFIEIPPDKLENESINIFLNKNSFKKLNYNNYEIVNKQEFNAFAKETINFNNSSLNITTIDKRENLERILKEIGDDEETIIYCSRKYTSELRAKDLMKENIFDKPNNPDFIIFLNHLKNAFSENWIVCKSLENGIGIHHGCIPKYIQKEIIDFFNTGVIKCVISTTTIIEGINTSAKNIIVYDYKKGKKTLKHFDAKNIAGRAGRFTHHYTGRVISLNNEFIEILNASNNDYIKHIDYDLGATKQDADLDIADEEYLTQKERNRKNIIIQEAKQVGLPDDILIQFKAVNKRNKIDMFKKIAKLSDDELDYIKKIGMQFASFGSFDFKSFDFLIRKMSDCIEDVKLKGLIEKESTNHCCVLTWLVKAYIENGFMGILNYKIKNESKSYDTHIRETANLIFNTFKYQLTKYLGVFDLLLRFRVGGLEHYKDVTMLGGILKKLEYGYINDKARKASDFGVPFKILQYFEKQEESIKDTFDEYEVQIFNSIIKLV